MAISCCYWSPAFTNSEVNQGLRLDHTRLAGFYGSRLEPLTDGVAG
ncbi:hypothetical protein [Streptomyces sp. CA-278952]